MLKLRVMVVVGTRPEVIKMAPIIRELKKRPFFETIVVSSGQQRELCSGALLDCAITVDFDLDLMSQNQTLNGFFASLLSSIDPLLASVMPAIVLVHGDTTTSTASSLAAFNRRIPVAHVEAGLRTDDECNPFPEEMNRRLTSRIASLHFAPTDLAKRNLIREGVPDEAIQLTGNSIVDAVEWAIAELDSGRIGLPDEISKRLAEYDQRVFVTVHRRESHGDGLISICKSIAALASEFPRVAFVFPVHPNPAVTRVVSPLLGSVENVILCEPLSYFAFIDLARGCILGMTDSGGLQEESPSLGVPLLILRSTTERPEVLDSGWGTLVGSDSNSICIAFRNLYRSQIHREFVSRRSNPFGNGRTSIQIAQAVEDWLSD